MNCRGDDDIDAKRLRPSIGKTRDMCHARLERVLLVGTRSADYIRASGQKRSHSKAVYMAAPDPLVEMSGFPLALRAPSIHGTFLPCRDVRSTVDIGWKAEVARTSPKRQE